MRSLTLIACLVLTAAATAAALTRGGDGAAAQVTAAEGSFSFTNSRDGMPIFGAEGIAPGDSATGTVEVASTGSQAGELVVEERDVADTPGPGGGLLSEQLRLRIDDITAPGNPTSVYTGPLASMEPQSAGVLAAGEARSFEFTATLPATTAGQNDLQGAGTSVGYRWTMREIAVEPPVDPEPPAPPPGDGTNPRPEGPPSPLTVTVTRARRSIHNGKLVLWVRCNRPCVASAKGRLRARAGDGTRSARLRFRAKRRYAGGTRALPIRVPGGMRAWLREHPDHQRLRARLTVRAKDRAGGRAAARRALRLR